MEAGVRGLSVGGEEYEDSEPEAKRKGASGLIETSNPNAVSTRNIKIKDMNSAAAAPQTRREREAAEKEAAAARYRKRHEQGLTEEYKKDMARLEEVKRRRAEAKEKEEEKKRLEEETQKEVRGWEVEGGTGGGSSGRGVTKLLRGPPPVEKPFWKGTAPVYPFPPPPPPTLTLYN
jgi:hypothetical protein